MKRILYLMLVLVLICGLFGCSDASTTADKPTTAEQTTSEPTEAPSTEPPTTEPPTTDPPMTEPAEPTVYLYDELGFRLTFPAHWEGRYTVEESTESNSVTVSADGAPVLTLVAVPNAPGAYERSMELYADGYEFYNESFDFSFFLKLHSKFPDDLSWHFAGAVGMDPVVLHDLNMLFSYNESTKGTAHLESAWLVTTLVPSENNRTYYNYRLGIVLDIPEELADSYMISPFELRVGVKLIDPESTSTPSFRESTNLLQIRVFDSDPIFEQEYIDAPLDLNYYTQIGTSGTRKYYLQDEFKIYAGEESEKYGTYWTHIQTHIGDIFSIIK